MRRIGITGGIACGKSEVTRRLRELGAAVTDADAISRVLTAEGGEALGEIRRAFGLSYFDEQDRLNRRKLAQTVFADSSARKTLEDILHPLVRAQIERELAAFEAAGNAVAFLDVPLLYEAGMEALCDSVWVVDAPREAQLRRLAGRDGLTEEEAEVRMLNQMPTREKAERADTVLRNDGSLCALRRQVTEHYQNAVRSAAGEEG